MSGFIKINWVTRINSDNFVTDSGNGTGVKYSVSGTFHRIQRDGLHKTVASPAMFMLEYYHRCNVNKPFADDSDNQPLSSVTYL